ncbi:hypothetical protein CW734_00940 (plasmid) [Planococcus sp. MB-3u-03]|uniref:hypothetical protein n=1 Tax=Planococcus sp. MB-3u-03 TaxID=2058136 RepID=UPI000C325619|nr:hypothetical protein [Planococcus sp. MB-3u-03]AUD12461.1 hypothetical protein CW734_00940 [Planococcus sp. MB-3u-03]
MLDLSDILNELYFEESIKENKISTDNNPILTKPKALKIKKNFDFVYELSNREKPLYLLPIQIHMMSQ